MSLQQQEEIDNLICSSAQEYSQEEDVSPTPNLSKPTPSSRINKTIGTSNIPLAVCPICLSPNTADGPHRLVVLPCGHLFGRGCITKWLSMKKQCPTCKKPSKKATIRKIYTSSVIVLDSSEKEKYERIISQERASKHKLKRENEQLRKRNKLLKATLESYKRTNRKRKVMNKREEMNFSNERKLMENFELRVLPVKSLQLQGGRVMNVSNDSFLTSCSMKNHQSDISYGLLRLCTYDLDNVEVIKDLHSKPIRDLKCGTVMGQNAVMTISDDFNLKITNLTSRSNVCTINTRGEGNSWACEFDSSDPNIIYYSVGHELRTYDLRNPTSPLVVRTPPPSFPFLGPLHSIKCVKINGKPHLWTGYCNAPLLWSLNLESNTPVSVPGIEGRCSSVSYDAYSDLLLASYRDTKEYRLPSHAILESTCGKEMRIIKHLHVDSPQMMLSRSNIYSIPLERGLGTFVVGGNEGTKTFMIWNVTNGNVLYTGKKQTNPIMDTSLLTCGSSPILTTLRSNQLSVYSVAIFQRDNIII